MKKKFNINYIKTLTKITRIIYDVDKRYIYSVMSIVIVTSLIPAASLKIMQEIINMIQTSIQDLKEIFILIIAYLSLGLFETIIQTVWGYYKSKFAFNFNLIIKREILQKASRLQLQDFEKSELYNMIQRAEQQGEGGLLSYFDKALNVIGMLITSISYFIIVLSFKSWIVPLLIIIPIIRFMISNKINKEEFNMVKKRTDDERKAWYYSYIITCGINYKELKLYDLFSHFIEKFNKLTQKFIKQDLGILQKRLKYLIIFNIFEQLLIGGLFSYTIYCGYIGVILIGDVITYTRAMISAKSEIQSVIMSFSELNKSSMFIEQLFDFMELEEKNISGTIKIDHIESITISHLSYKYHESDRYALIDVNLSIKRGDFIAIVGRNGSGKSTLMKILMGYYDEYEGEIFINNINLRDIEKDSYLKNIGALFQDFTKYEGTIRENVSYSNLNMINEDEKIYDVCRQFELEKLVGEQEKGIDTQLGFWFESGKQISFGQWQKVALSRTFMRNAELYFLDEPNAALDSISEFEMAQLYKKVFKDKIGFVITHKFNNFINNANKIIVLKDGRIVGDGNHESLLAISEEYEQLYNLQI
ncbi:MULTISPECIES: ABC transporter ATP-binding protein [unclassified Clostridium]|uniref:ABC transporter ATP-binding protein n=1 Tax=unclassified Clostridium TaxID=2614128 RepID=UPI0025BD23B2|nr:MULTISPECIES: ABC transporter ATP-binding protein [unclassified Clostridium]